ncbi:kelch repeat protein [Ancylostoma ceylanicum]|uniref:Kelch repeat protein n=1 Tax=Ancylostoma ceylanicum TaxID=53326 RepID=A0A0D6LIX6_9BILA|nr:kelch repeat protein [Ancylostoma ceylanicum]
MSAESYHDLILSTKDGEMLSYEHLRLFIDDDRLNVRSEDDVLNIIEAWIDTCGGRDNYRSQLLSVVRVAGLSAEKLNSLTIENRRHLLSEKPVRPPRDQMKQEWKPLCDLSLIHPIAYHGAVVLNDELYVIGGTDGENHYSTVMKMNMNGEWTEVAPMFETRFTKQQGAPAVEPAPQHVTPDAARLASGREREDYRRREAEYSTTIHFKVSCVPAQLEFPVTMIRQKNAY